MTADKAAGEGERPASRFRIFRASEAYEMEMPQENVTAVDEAGIAKAAGDGAYDGAFARMLFADEASGMSVGYVWFKPNFILPRHSHDADCAYYVLAGEAHLGTEVLRPGDGFFVPAGHNYQYTAGPEGVEVLEVRNATRFNIRLSGNSEAVWRRVSEMAVANRDRWRDMAPPPTVARMPR